MWGMLLSHITTERTNMYHILQKIADDYFCVTNVRKPIPTMEKAIEKVKALKVLDEDNTTYIITQKVGKTDE